MKLLIAADMEGISGITRWEMVRLDNPEYTRGRELMTADVNAAVEAAVAAGVEEIQVSDGHAIGTNILVEKLHPAASLHSGNAAPLAMIEGIQHQVDAAIFIGYHAMMGTPRAFMDHTWSSASVSNVWLNSQRVGEVAMNANLCGYYNIPVLAVSGDQALAAEARAFIPGIETAIVKIASSRVSGTCLPLDAAYKEIAIRVKQAIQNYKAGKSPAVLKISASLEIKVEFLNSLMAACALRMPGAVEVDGRTVLFTAKDMPEAFFAFRSMVTLAGI
jgi:D-amino peptidase